jgi:hypothetical protein
MGKPFIVGAAPAARRVLRTFVSERLGWAGVSGWQEVRDSRTMGGSAAGREKERARERLLAIGRRAAGRESGGAGIRS